MNAVRNRVSSKFGVKMVKFRMTKTISQLSNYTVLNEVFSEWVPGVTGRNYSMPPAGSGAGRGGGAGGSVRESGGGLGQYGAAQEEEYFFNKRREQLEKIKSKLKPEDLKSPPATRKHDK